MRELVPFRLTPRDFPVGSTVEVGAAAFDFRPGGEPGTAPGLTIHVTDPLEELRRAASDRGDGRLYKLLFAVLDKQEAARAFVTARLRNFRVNDARELRNRQRDVRRLAASALPVARGMEQAGSLPKQVLPAIEAIVAKELEPLEKQTAPPFNRSGDALTRHLNEVVLQTEPRDRRIAAAADPALPPSAARGRSASRPDWKPPRKNCSTNSSPKYRRS